MSQTVGNFIWQRRQKWGVRTVFGYPGDGVNGLLGGLQRTNGKVRFIQARHEEMATFMASAYAKCTGEVGVCLWVADGGHDDVLRCWIGRNLDHLADESPAIS